MTPKMVLSLLSAAIIVSLAMVTPAAAAQADAGMSSGVFDLKVDSGLLTLDARDAPLAEIMRAIGNQAGFEIIMTDDVDTSVTMTITDLSVAEALDRLLEGFDWVVVHDRQQDGTTDRAIDKVLVFESTSEVIGTMAAIGEPNGSAGTAESAMTGDAQQLDSRTRGRDLLRLVNSGATPEVLATLGEALQADDDAWVRGRAAAALGALRDERAVSDLAWALGDESASVRMEATQALGRIGGDRAVWALGAALVNGTTGMERIQAAWALGKQDSDLARQLLDAAAGDPSDLVWRSSQTPPRHAHRRDDGLPADTEQRGTSSIR